MGERKDDDEGEARGLAGFLEGLTGRLKEHNDKREKRDGKDKEEGGSGGALFAGLFTLAFGDKLKALDEKMLDWELQHERRALEIDKTKAERRRYLQRPAPKDAEVPKIIERLRRKVRDRSALVAEQERLIAEVHARRKGQALTEDDLREIENIKDAVARYLDELMAE